MATHRRFRGLTEKLDYLESLGVTAVWLLPFYPSPLKDDGYDISNYLDVNPVYGKLKDFRKFLRKRIKEDQVITELVINHTSDQHPWVSKGPQGQTRFKMEKLLRLERHSGTLQRGPHNL